MCSSWHGRGLNRQPAAGLGSLPTLPLPSLAITIILLLFIAENIVKPAERANFNLIDIQLESLESRIARPGRKCIRVSQKEDKGAGASDFQP